MSTKGNERKKSNRQVDRANVTDKNYCMASVTDDALWSEGYCSFFSAMPFISCDTPTAVHTVCMPAAVNRRRSFRITPVAIIKGVSKVDFCAVSTTETRVQILITSGRQKQSEVTHNPQE